MAMPINVRSLKRMFLLITQTMGRVIVSLIMVPRPEARSSAVASTGTARSQTRLEARNAATMAAIENSSRVAYSAAETEKPKGRMEEPTYKDEYTLFTTLVI